MSTQEIADPNTTPEMYSRFWFRFLELIPGVCVWLCLVLPFVLAFIIPDWVTIFVLVFDLFWLFKSLTYGGILLVGHNRMKKALSTDWHKELKALPQPSSNNGIDWKEIYHAIIVPEYKENIETLRLTIKSIIAADYSPDRLFFVLATEGRDAENAELISKILKKDYGKSFYKFIVTSHPDGIAGEIKGKGSNVAWAAHELTRQINEAHIPLENVIVTAADADSRFDQRYFLKLTYTYVTTPDRDRCAFQPVATFFNNIWSAPMLSRVLAFGTTFWQLIESMRAYRLITFSTHAMGLKTLVEMDYWCTSIVSEDSRQFFRGYFKFGGNFRVVPLFVPVYMDAVHVGSVKDDLKNLYLQQQRWAWGVEHFPYIYLECVKHKEIPFWDRAALVWRAFEGNFSWATAPYFISVVGWLPLLLNPNFHEHIIAFNFQFLTRYILTLTWIGLLISAFLTIRILPNPDKSKKSIWQIIMLSVQWVLTPITTTLFGALPAIDAQTRLMIGKYMGFRVTPKAR